MIINVNSIRNLIIEAPNILVNNNGTRGSPDAQITLGFEYMNKYSYKNGNKIYYTFYYKLS